MRKVLFFLGILDDSDLEWLIAVGGRAEFATGEVLIHEGQPIEHIFIVVDGSLTVTSASAGHREIARLQAGEIVGEMSFVDARPPSASVSAVEPSLLLAVPRTQLAAKLDGDTAFAARFYRALSVTLADRLRTTVSQLGYGKNAPTQQQIDDRDELDPDVLENLAIAGNRFDRLQRRVRHGSEE